MTDNLSWKQNKFLILLGLPSFGIALAYTLVTTYLPVFLQPLVGSATTGIMIGGEGVFALFIPYVIGVWSDAINTKMGKRTPFIFAGGIIICITLILMPINKNSAILLGIELSVFYIAYFTYYATYYAVFPDYVPNDQQGRSQGIQGAFRSLGLLLSLVGGGFLLSVWIPLPFLIVVVLLTTVTIIYYLGLRGKTEEIPGKEITPIQWMAEWKLLSENKKIMLWFICNSLWESAIAALKVFIVLYFIKGLHLSLTQTSVALSLVGIAAIFAAPLSGKLADQYGNRPVILIATILFVVGLTPALLTVNRHYIAGILPVAFVAVTLITLPYAILMGLLPKKHSHGAGAALFAMSQGIGALIGPLISGIVVEICKNINFLVFKESDGFAGIFFVTAVFLLISLPFTFALFQEDKKT